MLRKIRLVIFSATFAVNAGSMTYAQSKSVNVGTSISHPEAITGAWETRIAPTTIAGIAISVVATVNGAPTTLRGKDERVRIISIITYVRNAEQSDRTWWNSGVPAQFDWNDNRLRLHESRAANGNFDVDLDLIFDPAKSRWEGSFRNAGYSGHVLLERPNYLSSKSSPVGTWRSGPVNNPGGCIHIGIGVDGQLVAWIDYINLSGFTIYGANGTHPPKKTDESYGDFADDTRLRFGGDRWMFDLANRLGGEFVTGALSQDGLTFSGESTYYGNGMNDGRAHPFSWQRVKGDSCSA